MASVAPVALGLAGAVMATLTVPSGGAVEHRRRQTQLQSNVFYAADLEGSSTNYGNDGASVGRENWSML